MCFWILLSLRCSVHRFRFPCRSTAGLSSDFRFSFVISSDSLFVLDFYSLYPPLVSLFAIPCDHSERLIVLFNFHSVVRAASFMFLDFSVVRTFMLSE